MQRRQKIGNEIQIGFLRMEMAVGRGTKNFQPADTKLPAGIRYRAAILLDHLNHTASIARFVFAAQSEAAARAEPKPVPENPASAETTIDALRKARERAQKRMEKER